MTSVKADGREIPCEGVFILRATVAPTDLLPGLELKDGYIAVDRDMATSVPGVFAAGDCTGQPLSDRQGGGGRARWPDTGRPSTWTGWTGENNK